MSDANPVAGSSLENAATSIAGILEPNGPTRDDAAPEHANPEAEAPETDAEDVAERAPDQRAEEADPKPEGADADDEADEQSQSEEAEQDEGGELPDTLEGLAEALDMSVEDLSAHIRIPVKVNGQVQHVTLAEARNGFQMDADYRHKTAELADQRRQFDGAVQQATELLQSRLSTLDTHLQTAKKIVEAEEGQLDQLLSEGRTDDYLMLKRQNDARKAALQEAEADAAKLRHEQQQDAAQRYAQYIQAERAAAAEAWPELTDPNKGAQVKAGIKTYLKESGFSDEEMSQLVDHRQLLIVRDAMRYRAQQKAKPKIVKKLKGLPRVQKPGAAPDRGQQGKDRTAAKLQRLRKTGSARDAASVFLDMV